jgi:hypothetical protein
VLAAFYTDLETNRVWLTEKYRVGHFAIASIRAGRSHRGATMLLPNPRRSKRRLDAEMPAAIRASTERVLPSCGATTAHRFVAALELHTATNHFLG